MSEKYQSKIHRPLEYLDNSVSCKIVINIFLHRQYPPQAHSHTILPALFKYLPSLQLPELKYSITGTCQEYQIETGFTFPGFDLISPRIQYID
jgi:hypothetical protein